MPRRSSSTSASAELMRILCQRHGPSRGRSQGNNGKVPRVGTHSSKLRTHVGDSCPQGQCPKVVLTMTAHQHKITFSEMRDLASAPCWSIAAITNAATTSQIARSQHRTARQTSQSKSRKAHRGVGSSAVPAGAPIYPIGLHHSHIDLRQYPPLPLK